MKTIYKKRVFYTYHDGSEWLGTRKDFRHKYSYSQPGKGLKKQWKRIANKAIRKKSYPNGNGYRKAYMYQYNIT